MAQVINWDAVGQRLYQSGVDRVVLYVQSGDGTYPKGVAWNGVTAINESPSGAEANPQYADNIKYLNLQGAEEYGFTIEAFMFPDEFNACNGFGSVATGVAAGQQSRSNFGLAFRTMVGNDVEGISHGYKLHLVWGCLAAPSEMSNSTINENPEAVTFSWEVSTTPAPLTGFKPVSTMVIDSTKVAEADLTALETLLYGVTGTPNTEGKLPTPDEVKAIFVP